MTNRTTVQNAGLFLALAAMWGSSFPGIKIGLAYFPPVFFAALRYDIAAVILIIYASFTTNRFRPRGIEEWTDVVISGVLIIGVFQALLFIGEQYTSSALAAILVSTSPILATGFTGVLLPDEHLHRTGYIGLTLGFLGVIIVVRPDPASVISGGFLGEALILLSAASFAFGSVITRRLSVRGSLSVETREAWAMVTGAVLLHGMSLALGESPLSIQWTTIGVTALLYLAIIPSALGYLVYFDLLARRGPIEVNLVSYVNPIFATLIGWALLGEALHWTSIIGFIIIFIGFTLIKHEQLRSRFRGISSWRLENT